MANDEKDNLNSASAEDSDYESLLYTIAQNNCALILGPDFLFINRDEQELAKVEKQFFTEQKFPEAAYLKEDGFFYQFSKNRSDLAYHIVKFYEAQPYHEYYTAIARLPFNFIISLSPDIYIRHAFDIIGREYEFIYQQNKDFYRLDADGSSSKIQEVYSPSLSKKCLILNLYGLYNKQNSLILTYKDFFAAFAGLMDKSNLKLDIKNILSDIGSFLFLGFSYNKWHVNFLFFLIQYFKDALSMDAPFVENKGVIYFTEEQAADFDFYKKAFSFSFMGERTTDFINKLSAKGNNILYTSKNTNTNSALVDATTKMKVLYLSSLPDDMPPTDAAVEHDRIFEVWQKYGQQTFDFIQPPKQDVPFKDLIQFVNDIKPHVLIISAHGNEKNELLFINENNEKITISSGYFEEVIRFLTTRSNSCLECIIFSSCDSDVMAKKIKPFLKCSIGSHGPYSAAAAVEFADGFFRSFFSHRDYNEAFDNGVLFVNKLVEDQPQLKNFVQIVNSKV